MIRKATINDIDAISSIYEHIHDMAESGKYSLGWIRGSKNRLKVVRKF